NITHARRSSVLRLGQRWDSRGPLTASDGGSNEMRLCVWGVLQFHSLTVAARLASEYFGPGLDMQPFGCILLTVMDAVFKALADESRRKLLDELHKDNGQTLTQLCRHLDMTRQAVTKHLGLLEAANLVATVWQGREKLHYLNPMPLHEIYERWISK